MPDQKEVKLPTPAIVKEASEAIRVSGQFKKGLNGQEVSGLIKGVVGDLVTNNPQVKGGVPFMDVKISGGQADIKGTIRVESPIGATIGVDIILRNHRGGGNRIELGNLRVDPKADGLVGSLALKALDIEGKARGVLSDPTQALNIYLTTEMRKQGIKLDGIAMKFTQDDKFTVLLKGASVR